MHYGRLHSRPRTDHPRTGRSGDETHRSRSAGTHQPVACPHTWCAASRRTHRSHRRHGAPGRTLSRRRTDRDPQRGRYDGAYATADGGGRTFQHQDHHHPRSNRLPPPHRVARGGGRRGEAAHRIRSLPHHPLPPEEQRAGACGADQGQFGRTPGRTRAGARTLLLHDGRHLRLPALRLRRAAPHGYAHDRKRRARRGDLPQPRGPRHRADGQDPRLQAARRRHGHRRGEPAPLP